MSQVSAIRRYSRTQSAEAFAQIVEKYQRLVLATCRRNLRDPADVDDAVQETFLRLAQRASELHTNPGGWLHRCAVNVSIDITRRRQTRDRHESASIARSRGEEAQTELRELREHLDAALEKIDPAMAELIVERYFVGRSQIEMAAETGVAASTMSERLDRAIGMLREQLKSMGCIAAGAGLIGLLEAEHVSAAVAPALTSSIMKIGVAGVTGAALAFPGMSILLALAAAIALAIGVRLLLGQTAAPTAQKPAVVSVVAATQPTTTPSAEGITVGSGNPGDSPAPPVWKTAKGAEVVAVLSGRVADKAGKPIANAKVTLITNGPVGINQEVTTDNDGKYAFPDVREVGNYRVGVAADGFVAIEAYSATDPAIQLSPDTPAKRDFVLDRGVVISVKVVDPGGAAFAGAHVDVGRVGDRMRTVLGGRKDSNKNGIASFTIPVSKTGWIVSATSDGWAPAHAVVTPDSADVPKEVNLSLNFGLTVTGTAICKDGKPAAGWKIYAQPEWWVDNYLPPMVPIDKDGNFTLTDVGPGNYALWISADNSSRPVANVTMPPTTQPIRVDVPMASPGSLVNVVGRLKFIGTRPRYVRISAMSLGGDREFYNAMAEFRNSGRGNPTPAGDAQYTLNLPPGRYRISFESETTEANAIDNLQIPGDVPVVTLKSIEKPSVSGTVEDAASGNPLTHFAVRVRKVETIGNGGNYVQDARWIQISDSDGHFKVELVGAGIYQVQISADGYAWIWSPETRIEKGSMDLAMKMTAGGSLSGTVVDPAGQPVAGAKVIPLSMARSIAMRAFDRFESQAGAATTDSGGHFTINHLAEGDETLKIVAENLAPMVFPNLRVGEGQIRDAGAIKLKIGGTVEGVVYDAGGAPAAGVALQFQDNEGYGGQDDEVAGRVATAQTDEAGHFRVEHLAEQVLYVNLADRGQRDGVARRLVRPLDGKTARLDFGGTKAVTGRLMSADGPVANKKIELSVFSEYFGPVMDTSTMDGNGRFTFFGPPVGKYTLFIERGGRDEWTPVADVLITDSTSNLGEIKKESGDVKITIVADDPADGAGIRYLQVCRGFSANPPPNGVMVQFDPKAGGCVAKDIPAGEGTIVGRISPNVQFQQRFKRNAGDAQTEVTFHVPMRNASLTLAASRETATAGTSDTQPPMGVLIRSDDSLMTAYLSPGFAVKLPAGAYRVLDAQRRSARTDIEAIVLKDGESKQIEFPPAPAAGAAADVGISVWKSDGVLDAGAVPRLIGADGKVVEALEFFGVVSHFHVKPGRYRAEVDREGGTPFVQEIEVEGIVGDPDDGAMNLVESP